MITLVKYTNAKQSVWEKDGKYYLCSTSLNYIREVMVFKCNSEGKVEDWLELYCSRYYVENHSFHMSQWNKETINASD
jgi:hypothetical protein